MLLIRSIDAVILSFALLGCWAWPGRACAAEFADSGRVRDIVVVGPSPDHAAMIAGHAAAMRRDIHTMLIGSAPPRPWVPVCEIHVHATPATFARAVAGAPRTATGATSIEFVGDVVRLRRIDVVAAAGGGIPAALNHELVHCVLADRFPHGPPPRWADEGLAMLFDAPAKQQGHEADFQAAVSRGQTWSLADLMAFEAEPSETSRQRVFYGQSAAVVRWLLARGDGPMFLRFLDDAAAEGTTAALRTHYRLASLPAMEQEWRANPADLPAGPEPHLLPGRHEPHAGAVQ